MNTNGGYPASDLNGSYAALDMGGTWRRYYNCRADEGCAGGKGPRKPGDQPWAWPSWGCGIPPTNASTNKNYVVEGNILLGPVPVTVACKYNNTEAHVCCNNTVTRNAVNSTPAGPTGGNVPTAMALSLSGDLDHRDWDFETELRLTVRADHGPARAATSQGGPGTDIDFFGRKRLAGASIQAGPFEHLAGATTEFKLWPPPTDAPL